MISLRKEPQGERKPTLAEMVLLAGVIFTLASIFLSLASIWTYGEISTQLGETAIVVFFLGIVLGVFGFAGVAEQQKEDEGKR
jgi:hypothetical protein